MARHQSIRPPLFSPPVVPPSQITNSDFSDAKAVQRLADAWHETPAFETLSNRLETPHSAPLATGAAAGCMSGVRQLRALIWRAAMNSIRDPAAYALRYDMISVICSTATNASIPVQGARCEETSSGRRRADVRVRSAELSESRGRGKCRLDCGFLCFSSQHFFVLEMVCEHHHTSTPNYVRFSLPSLPRRWMRCGCPF